MFYDDYPATGFKDPTFWETVGDIIETGGWLAWLVAGLLAIVIILLIVVIVTGMKDRLNNH